jgi:hypothetical protein
MPIKADKLSSQHLMLLYETDGDRDGAAINYINKALEEGQFALYASVNVKDTKHMKRITSKIRHYRRHLEQGNLLVVNLHLFYQRALSANLEPFYDLKAMLEAILKERIAAGKRRKATVVADCADQLSRNEKFDECIIVERWWHNTYSEWLDRNVNITVVCPHPNIVLGQETFMRNKQQLSELHSLTISAISK